jgi:hypothetical protein
MADTANDKRELTERETLAHERWWDSLVAVPPNATRADGWTLRDVVAHVAAWQRYSTHRIATFLRDGIDPGPPADTDRFNEDARSTSGSWEHVRDDAHEAHRRLVDSIASIPESRLADGDGLIPFIVRVNASEHYEEHPASDFAR